jgi:maltooligosyltrehalose trehalohydrolase
MRANWTPAFGPVLDGDGARLRICAPGAATVDAWVGSGPPQPLTRVSEDVFEGHVPGARAGDRYRLQRDGSPSWPDPCSRWQPEGVHGPSMLVDPGAFDWTDQGWRGVPRHRLAIYELHVGTFTPAGTFAAAADGLPAIAELGVTAIELMPVAAFPGARNWGYDGAALFSPSERYGHPDQLRALVDRAHALGLAVLLDVVYNHLGPDGAYLAAWMPTIFTDRHRSPWGRGINLDGPGSTEVRRLICDNALHWLLDYHIDGLRLDATHALTDESDEHILAQLSREVAAAVTGREVHLIAEDERNLDTLLLETERGGYGMTGVWADDFHHPVRRHLASDHEAWFADFQGSMDEIATAVREGWVFSGQHAAHHGGPRGTSPAGVPIEASVICLQNHDQVGNRAHGERLHHQIDLDAWLAATTLLLMAPETPLLFMGQEWAASTPFMFFTDHEGELAGHVSAGRRQEFGRFSAFADPAARDRIPDPQGVETFERSVLQWEERLAPPHASVLAQTATLLSIRNAHVSARPRSRTGVRCAAVGPRSLWLEQPSALGGVIGTFIEFAAAGRRTLPAPGLSATHPLHVLYASSADGAPAVKSVSAETDAIVIDASPTPLGLVIHLPAWRADESAVLSADLAKAGASS